MCLNHKLHNKLHKINLEKHFKSQLRDDKYNILAFVSKYFSPSFKFTFVKLD